MNYILDDILMHYGMPRRSGRYPWGSGENPYQHSGDFLSRVEELRKQNFTFTDADGKTYTGDLAIAKSMGLTSTQFRTQYSLAKDERRTLEVARAKSLREDGLSLREIAEKMLLVNTYLLIVVKHLLSLLLQRGRLAERYHLRLCNNILYKGSGNNLEQCVSHCNGTCSVTRYNLHILRECTSVLVGNSSLYLCRYSVVPLQVVTYALCSDHLSVVSDDAGLDANIAP